MRVPLSWLNEYVEVKNLPIEALRQRCDLAGLEIGSIDIIGHPGAELPWDPDKIVTAEVLNVRAHPNADRLVLAEVNYGGQENEIVVTGAPSLYERKGQTDLHLKVAFAWEGAMLYDGHREDWVKRKLKSTKIRGVRSRAMVCSEKELGLAEEQTDIIYLAEDTPVGVPLVDVLGDYVLDFDIKGPFGHLQSVYGIAREIAALLDRPLQSDPLGAIQRLGATLAAQTDFIHLEIADPDLCPRYTATMIRDITIAPSPLWMQMRLQRAGVRPISNIVDITNYVMLELGEPLHAFDHAQLETRKGEDKPAIVVRRAQPGEQMHTLDGELRTFDEEMLLITDGRTPVGIAGVMGGLDSEVDEETEDVLLEAASFNFLNVRRTSQVLKLSTEAASRFGKRVDSELAAAAAARAAELMASLCDGQVDPTIGDVYPGKPEPVTLCYNPALADRILGIEVPVAEQRRILSALEFDIREQEDGKWQVGVPSYRLDVSVPVDLVEEVGRMWGYDKFPHTLIDEPVPPLRDNVALMGEDRVRDIMVALGLDEIITYSLVDPEDEARLQPAPDAGLTFPGDPVTLLNSLSPERSQMRRTLLASVLRATWANLRFSERVAVFEVGCVYYWTGSPDVETAQTGVAEPRHLAMLLTGPRQERWWEPTDRALCDYFDLKGLVEALLANLSLETLVQWERGDHPSFHPGRCAKVSVNQQSLGYIGELHPLVREAFDLPEQPIVLLEWDLDVLLDAAQGADVQKRAAFVSTYPLVHEDLAFVVEESVPALDVQRAIMKAGDPLVTRALLFDTYRGPQVGAGRKSLAFALTYQSPSKPLKERDVEKLRKRIIKRLEKDLGAVLRSA